MAEKEKTCCFSGHRIIPVGERERVKEQLKNIIPELYSGGIDTFLCGGAVGFDMLAAESVLAFKAKMRDIRLVMALPCINQAEKWSVKQRRDYNRILSAADEVIYLSEEYTKGCMHVRNRFMVGNSAVCVCYCRSASGGTAYTVEQARRLGLKIYNVAETFE